MSLLTDEYGRPIILFDSGETKERVKGVEAYRVRKKTSNRIPLLKNINII